MGKIYKWWKHQQNENISGGDSQVMDIIHQKQ